MSEQPEHDGRPAGAPAVGRPHILVVTPVSPDSWRDDSFSYSVECPGVTEDCRGWRECPPGMDDENVFDALEDEGDDEPVAHGRRHRKVGGSWMAETTDCYVATHYDLLDVVEGNFAPGRHSISWSSGDGTELEIRLLSESEASVQDRRNV